MFYNTSTPALRPIHSPMQWVARELSPKNGWLRREAHHSSPATVDIKNAWSYEYICLPP